MRGSLVAVFTWYAIAASAEEPAPSGYVVLAGDAYDDEGMALIAAAGAGDRGIPRHEDYPQVVPLAPYGRTGFGLAVAVPTSREAADRLVRALQARGTKAEALPAAGLPAEELRVLAVDAVRVTGNGAPLFPYEVCVGPLEGKQCWATGTLDDDARFVVPFLAVPEGTVAALKVTAGRPWSCPAESLGPVELGLPVWLKAPVRVDCFEDSTPAKRKPPR